MKRVIPALVVLVLAGCGGGGQSDKEKIKSTVRDYFTAFADGDLKEACDQLAAKTREDFVKAAHGKSCSAVLGKAAQRPDVKRFASQLRNPRVLSVDINGKDANVKVRALNRTTTVPVHKEGDRWKIQGKVGEGG
jgi:ketosteroid isomerase-like protein